MNGGMMESPYLLTERIRIGISACNFGAKVRWNRRGWDRLDALGRERLDYTWTPVCPEVNSGLGVPRAPIRLITGNGDDLWTGGAEIKDRNGRNVTALMKTGMQTSLGILKQADIHAYVFMEGSPSCGVYRTTLRDKRLGKPPGAFGSLLLREAFFLIPAVDLESPVKWWDWRRRLHAFIWLTRAQLSDKQQVYDIWYHFKFLCQEVNDAQAREIGRELAAMPKAFAPEFVESWRMNVLRLIRQPSSFKRIHAIMLKHYAHFRRTFNISATVLKVPESTTGKTKFVEELNKLERLSVEKGYEFTGAPIIYRPER